MELVGWVSRSDRMRMLLRRLDAALAACPEGVDPLSGAGVARQGLVEQRARILKALWLRRLVELRVLEGMVRPGYASGGETPGG